jgi:hypothetical protein
MSEQDKPRWREDEFSEEDNPSWEVEVPGVRMRIVWFMRGGGYWRLFLNGASHCDLPFKKNEAQYAQRHATQVVAAHYTALMRAIQEVETHD